MYIGLISDTHGSFDPEIREFLSPVDELWHAGDFGSGADFAAGIAAFKPLVGVYGNCDGQDIRHNYPSYQYFEREGLSVLMTHIGGSPGHYDLRAQALIEHCKPQIFAFNLRLARFIMDGKIGDFDWRVQIQGTNATGPGQPTVQMIDLYTEWRRFPEFKIRAGQFKRAFTFENPTNPITQGWRSYADIINKLSAFGDRTGEKSSGGRDIGIQLSGDLFPNASGRRVLHYQIGVYNGEGVNEKDKDNRKDIIGGLWVMPIKGVRIGAFGWT
ncbi:MAG: metallophosphoesterase family protein, partial [Bacteroidales bacterium]|nr:metallophosphoesterase family protein [Bacteroidales bacterium]